MERVLKQEELAELSRWAAAIAPTGREDGLRTIIIDGLQRDGRGTTEGATWEVDALGNLVVTAGVAGAAGPGSFARSASARSGTDIEVAISAPLDEPGLLVTHIDGEGWLRVELLGGLTPAGVVGRQVAFRGRSRTVWGVVAPERRRGDSGSGRSSEGAGSELRIDELFVDVGATSRGQVEEELSPGSAGVIWYGEVVAPGLLAERLTGKALGRRSLAYLLYTMVARVRGRFGFIFAAQSLLGGRGIQPAVYRLGPEVLVVLQPVPAADWPATAKGEVRLGGGPVLVVHAGAAGSDRELLSQAEERAAAHGIRVQRWVADERVATDLSQGAWVGGGVRVLGLGLPVREVAGGPETICASDWLALRELLIGLLTRPILARGR